jgi:pyruvate dehydrogenase complex dehydrogenase (E1) component
VPYNEIMARGWESKSIEAQIESAADRKPAHRETKLSPEQIQTMRDRENLELSRTRVQRELASSTNPRYQEILRRGLADLEAKIAQLEPAKKAVAAAAR